MGEGGGGGGGGAGEQFECLRQERNLKVWGAGKMLTDCDFYVVCIPNMVCYVSTHVASSQ